MGTPARTRFRWKPVLGVIASIVIVVGIFAWAIPKFADYGAVLDALGSLTPIEFWTLFAAMVFNLVTYWWANQAALPGLGIGKLIDAKLVRSRSVSPTRSWTRGGSRRRTWRCSSA